jgi:RNA polymerase sigma-70 factor, ECF subfamily
MTDERLLARARQGDEAAFVQLYERHRGLVFRFAYRLSQSVEWAEEITHDCFMQLLKEPQRFASDAARASLRTWLCAIARNLVYKRLRRHGHEVEWEEGGDARLASANLEPLQRVLSSEIAEAVRQAVAALPPLQREALILFEYEELSLREIAALADTDIGTIKARLHRARAGLRLALAPYQESCLR